ncbi:hypothetical protein OHU11_21390 [Streptomyces sp. NBC_00257]|uniref:hypothetical protein n=1 Tax=unclassified Streptomyces TaxID=2593676 RepID=UPI0022579B94|nr:MULTISPECIES: hypothetical protein [unclassified Streptomyces]WTB55639.1 hypothetical protein OG832_21995 [Streptomyces sp. NBC_00826]WTH91478.1 hypothetical protein OIC43_21700 [Streptomyces sp. NBC_00825]WTI00206.1 hypothetical protein OHA23_21685 [Streptomyces sp. NBC_00822]MCX4865699.1 hypothetical protein [Streptomyces sp. NBC_00906]MCX4896938.1 hypothetical protein [Streptomyces sp. NBC_00892]
MSDTGASEELGALSARARAHALLRIRGRAAAVAILPAAVAVVLLVAGAQGLAVGSGWDTARWAVTALAVVVLLLAAAVAVAIVRARPAVSPTIPLPEKAAPDLYRLVRDLADRLGVPAPSAIALTPDCDSWLEDRTHPSARPAPGTGPDSAGHSGVRSRRVQAAPVLVIGSPFLWWMRVAELRAVLAPVVAGTGPAAHPDIAAARRFVRGLDGAVADAAAPVPGPLAGLRRVPRAFVGRIARLLLRSCRGHAAEMERSVAAAASVRAQGVDYGLRIVAQEQVGLAYAGWDRLLTRVALPAWRMGRWPSRLDAGVVSALTELSRRDRLADGFTSRLGERPACDLLEEPGAADEAASLLAARLFHGGPARPGPDWSPVDWQQYPEEVVDRKWRTEAARLHRVLDSMAPAPSAPSAPHAPSAPSARPAPAGTARAATEPAPATTDQAPDGFHGPGDAHARPDATSRPAACPVDAGMPTLARVVEHLAGRTGGGEELAAGISAAVAREEAAAQQHRAGDTSSPAGAPAGPGGDVLDPWGPDPLPLFPLQPPRTGTELLADHVAAMVCCAAVDTAGATPGLDWLDGPALLIDGERRADLGSPVLSLVEDGDAEPLRSWLASIGVRTDKPVRLV